MKQKIILSLFFATVFAISCKKYERVITLIHLPPLNDTATVLLKDIVREHLPAPYYHFVYDNNKYVTEISFASNLDVYRLQYDNKRLKRMLNINNNNHLEYTYNGNIVSLITEFSGITEQKRYEVFFDYNVNRQLRQVNWFRFINNGTVRKPYRKVLLTYNTDGNLHSLDDFFTDTTGELVLNTHKLYQDYDNGINVEDFSLLKNFFEPLLYLPSIRLQKNNPGTEIITEADNDFRVTYHYQYINGLPVVQSGTMTQTRGTNSGQSFDFFSSYNYY